jgi:hypothetical protein
LVLMLASTLSPHVFAQDASTPVAEIAGEPEQPAPAETAPPTEIAAPTPTPTAESTEAPTEAPAPNADSIAPLTQSITLQPGQTIELALAYQVTTARVETGLHIELRTAASAQADGWVLAANGTGGFGAIDIVDTETEPGALALTVRLTAPEDALDGDTLTLFVSSVVHTIAGEIETGVPPDTAVAAIVVNVPDPTPAEPAATTPATNQETLEPSATATSEMPAASSPESTSTGTPEPADSTPVPATPQPEIPASPMPETPSPTPEVAIDLASELTLVGRKPHDTVTIGESHSVTLEYRYTAGFARTGTTISAQVVNWNGEPAANWSVRINGAPNTFHDAEHLDTGSTFDVEVTITAGEDAPANSKARLLFTVAVDPAEPEAASSTFALASVESTDLDAGDATLSETFEGPMLRVDDGFTTASVSASDNGLTCHNANGYAGGDSLIPGQTILFKCDLTIAPISILGTFSGTATITLPSPNTAGWKIMASSQVALLGATLLSPSGNWKPDSVSFSGLGVLSLNEIKTSGGLSFGIWVQAPTIPLTIGANAITVSVTTTCAATLGLTDCNNRTALTGYDATSAAQLTANVADIQTIEHGGGAVTDLGLLGSLGTQISNGLIFSLACTRSPGTTTQIQPHQVVDIPCTIKSLIDLKILGTLSTVTANVSLSFSNTADANWHYSIIDGIDRGKTATLNIRSVLESGGLGAEYPFTVRVMYTPSGCVSTAYSNEKLNALQVTAAYGLRLSVPVLGVASNITLTDGWANIPVQLAGISYGSAAYTPLLSADGINFGSFQFSRTSASYTRVGGAAPTLAIRLSPTGGTNCSGQMWYVTAQFSPLAGYRDSSLAIPLGTTIPANWIAFNGSASNPNTSVTTIVPAVTGSPNTIITSTATLLTTLNISFPMALTPPPSQPVGYYLGTVTLTVVSGTPL